MLPPGVFTVSAGALTTKRYSTGAMRLVTPEGRRFPISEILSNSGHRAGLPISGAPAFYVF
jgi:hypothetical protein